MKFLSNFKNYINKIKQVENNIVLSTTGFLEVYERNIALEKEIELRTTELNQANQTILTLQNIWEMLNSSQPLSNVLDKIVNSLHGEMGYVNSTILQKTEDSEGVAFFAKSYSVNVFIKEVLANAKDSSGKLRIPYEESSIIVKAIADKKIYHTKSSKEILKLILTNAVDEKQDEILSYARSKSAVVIPLYKNNDDFGCLLVFSDREEPTENELNFLQLFADQIELAITIADLFQEVKKQAITDPLTGLYNRRYFEENIIKEAERSLRLKQPFSLVSIDLDYLKSINDKYGHQYGDIAIQTIAEVIKRKARSIDIPARIGGEEFNLLLPGIDSYGALIAAERLRAAIEEQKIEKVGTITASIGVSTFLEHSDRVDELIEFADQAMYKAKIGGRNRVEVSKPQKDTDWQKIAVGTFIDILSKKRIPVPEDVSSEISEKLEKISLKGKNSKDTLYSVVDLISQTYNNTHATGTTKSKLLAAVMLAKKIGLTKPEIDKLKIAMLLYDIGNSMIPEDIFNKKDPLTEEERAQIKTHPIIAAREILKPITTIQDVIPIIEHHHENWDGTGYPNSISGNEIPVTSQIILLIDAYFALIHDRPYRKAYDVDKAIEIIRCGANKQWNEDLVEEFIYIIRNESID